MAAEIDYYSPWTAGWRDSQGEVHPITSCQFPDLCHWQGTDHEPEYCHVNPEITLFREMGLEGH